VAATRPAGPHAALMRGACERELGHVLGAWAALTASLRALVEAEPDPASFPSRRERAFAEVEATMRALAQAAAEDAEEAEEALSSDSDDAVAARALDSPRTQQLRSPRSSFLSRPPAGAGRTGAGLAALAASVTASLGVGGPPSTQPAGELRAHPDGPGGLRLKVRARYPSSRSRRSPWPISLHRCCAGACRWPPRRAWVRTSRRCFCRSRRVCPMRRLTAPRQRKPARSVCRCLPAL
jgi:hypothetical protein